MSAVCGEHSPSCYQVKFWNKQFKWGKDSIEDDHDPRSGRPLFYRDWKDNIPISTWSEYHYSHAQWNKCIELEGDNIENNNKTL